MSQNFVFTVNKFHKMSNQIFRSRIEKENSQKLLRHPPHNDYKWRTPLSIPTLYLTISKLKGQKIEKTLLHVWAFSSV